jgi:hypothetical protein
VDVHVHVCADHACLVAEGDDGFIESRELVST